MDKLLPAIDWFKKNGFWVGCGVLAAAMIGTWFAITMQISEETAKNAQDVKSQIQAAQNIMKVSAEEGAAAHPNASTEAGMKRQLETAIDELVKAWEIRYERQQEILKWPEDVLGDNRFVPVFRKFEPAEQFPAEHSMGLGMEQYLQLYRVTIPNQMIKLARMLDTNWNYDPKMIENQKRMDNSANSGANEDGDFGDDDEEDGDGGDYTDPGVRLNQFGVDLNDFAVIWNDENQALWYRKLTDFAGKDNHTLATPDPTPLQVYMLQQDLWLLEAMFKVIKSVNGDADANDLAVIKEIDHVAFGREARIKLGELTPYDPRLAGLELVAESGEVAEGDLDDMEDDMEDDDADGDGFNKLSFAPYHGRYVDPNFEPLHADVVTSVLNNDTDLPTENLELIVAKRVPFRIALKMDERKIPEFLAACANSPFAFEVRQIRLNRHVPNLDIVFNGGGYGENNEQESTGSMRGGLNDSMGDLSMGNLDSGRGGSINVVVETTDVEIRTNYDVKIEFYGIVKIYNPVREKFLRRAAGLDVGDPNPNDAASTATGAGNSASKP